MLHLAHHRLSHGTPARNVLQKFGNVLDPLGAAVRDQQNCGLAHDILVAFADVLNSCTKSARFLTLSTGVSGKMPCPRLKMWPGRLSASRRMCSARCFTSFHEANSVTGSRFPCTACLCPTVCQPSSSGTRQSNPITSAPVSDIEGSSVVLSVPK